MREDFRDFYERRGAEVHGSYFFRDENLFSEATIAYIGEREYSLEPRVSWSFFGGDKVFRANPPIDEGILRGIRASSGVSTMRQAELGQEGWDIHGAALLAGHGLGGDFDFQQYTLDIRSHQSLGEYDNAAMRFCFGTAHGYLPLQRTFELGGLGTLPGYSFKSLTGPDGRANRMLLLNIEYMMNGDAFREFSFWPSFLLKHVNLLLIADAGLVRTEDAASSALTGFNGITWGEIKSDVGLGICSRSGAFRIGAAWRTDRAEPGRLFLRIAPPF